MHIGFVPSGVKGFISFIINIFVLLKPRFEY
jgi:hypothetical protein